MSPSLSKYKKIRVRVQEPNTVITNEKIQHRAKINHPLLQYNFKSLEVDKIFTLLLDKIIIHSSYDSTSQAAKVLNTTKFSGVTKFNNRIADYINRYLNSGTLSWYRSRSILFCS